MTCHAGQVCSSSYWEGSQDLYYECDDMPDTCADNPTCDCLTATVCYGQSSPHLGEPGELSCGCDATGCFIPCVIP